MGKLMLMVTGWSAACFTFAAVKGEVGFVVFFAIITSAAYSLRHAK